METIIIIAVAIGSYLLLLLVFQFIDILNLKKQKLKAENTISTTTTKATKIEKKSEIAPSILGKTKAISRQSLSKLDSSRQPHSETLQAAPKPTTFASQATTTVSEQVEYEVDLPIREVIDNPSKIDCFNEEETTEVSCSVVNKELGQLNRLMEKKKLNATETETALTIVAKIDQTRFFETIITEFEKGKQKHLLLGLREKIKERELATHLDAATETIGTTQTATSAVMSDKELENYL